MLSMPQANPDYQASVAQQPVLNGLAATRAKDAAADQRVAELSGQLEKIDKELAKLDQLEAVQMIRANQVISDIYDSWVRACNGAELLRLKFERERFPLRAQRLAIHSEARPILDRRVAENDLAALLKMPRPSLPHGS
jgi:hypothetical protein